jgi:hypothetical protein
MNKKFPKGQAKEDLPLSKAAQLILDESRMFLPGIQALFGFQLIAVFNQTFSDKLSPFEQQLHLLAIGLVVLTTIIIMTPAAYHRQMEVKEVTESFIHMASKLMLISMMPLSLSISLDFYLVSRLILKNASLALVIGVVSFALFILEWMVIPRTGILNRLLGER